LTVRDTDSVATLGVIRSNVPDRLPALDGVRAVAVLGVIASHSGLFGLGWLGVDIFFGLSGYLITGILLDGKAAATSARGYFVPFYIRRSLRILPLAWAVAILMAGIRGERGGLGLVPGIPRQLAAGESAPARSRALLVACGRRAVLPGVAVGRVLLLRANPLARHDCHDCDRRRAPVGCVDMATGVRHTTAPGPRNLRTCRYVGGRGPSCPAGTQRRMGT
jgi:hypothetical protein